MTPPIRYSYAMDIKGLVDNIGSTGGLIGAGLFLVAIYHWLACGCVQRVRPSRPSRL